MKKIIFPNHKSKGFLIKFRLRILEFMNLVQMWPIKYGKKLKREILEVPLKSEITLLLWFKLKIF